MADLIREAPIGQIIRYLTNDRVLRFPEELPDFKLPESYAGTLESASRTESRPGCAFACEKGCHSESTPNCRRDSHSTRTSASEEQEKISSDLNILNVEAGSIRDLDRAQSMVPIHASLSRTSVQGHSHPPTGLEHHLTTTTISRAPSQQIIPQRTSDGAILVDWYTTDDPANPQNWSLRKKIFAGTIVCLYTLAVYMGSAIITPSYSGIMEEYGVSLQAASLSLSMYVLAYGIGPMIFSPISEMPSVGRNPPYIITFLIFLLMIVPGALTRTFAGLIIARFLQGFFGSPCLATGGASMQDLFSLPKLPYALSMWSFACTCGPALGPIISGFSVPVMGWRWSQWELLWLSGPIWLVMLLFMPETSSANILLRRARRLRALTGDPRLQSQGEIDQSHLTMNGIIVESLRRPIELMLLDPSTAFTAVYIALIYGIFYSFFESFPMVYMSMHGLNLGQMGLVFLSITVGALIGMGFYWSYTYWVSEPQLRAQGIGAPERRLIPSLFAAFAIPVGLFLFAWTASPSIHWIVPTIGVVLFSTGIFLIFQCVFMYLPFSYPEYAASLFAGNDLARSALGAGTIHFAIPLYKNLGIGRGVTLLAGLTCGCIAGLFVLYIYGARLRARSRFTSK